MATRSVTCVRETVFWILHFCIMMKKRYNCWPVSWFSWWACPVMMERDSAHYRAALKQQFPLALPMMRLFNSRQHVLNTPLEDCIINSCSSWKSNFRILANLRCQCPSWFLMQCLRVWVYICSQWARFVFRLHNQIWLAWRIATFARLRTACNWHLHVFSRQTMNQMAFLSPIIARAPFVCSLEQPTDGWPATTAAAQITRAAVAVAVPINVLCCSFCLYRSRLASPSVVDLKQKLLAPSVT